MSVAGATTVIGDNEVHFLTPEKPKREFSTAETEATMARAGVSFSQYVQPIEELEETRQFFVSINPKDGVLGALRKLDTKLVSAGEQSIFSKKNPTDWIGHEINPGFVGLVNHGGLPKLLNRPGRYPRFPLRWWWAREYRGSTALSETVIEFQGLTVVQVSQNQAAVVSDPQNRIFIVKNGGFVAMALTGSYTVLQVIDQTHLSNAIKDQVTGATLGWTQEVKMARNTGASGRREFVVALFLNIPANNCAILQKGDDLQLLPAGQHYIIDPNVTLRGMFTFGEAQLEMGTKDVYTRDQVPVSLTIYLKWQLMSPLALTQHGYPTPYEALRDKTQSILTQIVAHLDYSSMVKQRNIGPEMADDVDSQSAFLDALRTRAMDELLDAAKEYGIVLKDLAVIDRQFKGPIANTMDQLTSRSLQAQVEAVNVDRENSNKVKKEQGQLEVVQVQALARRTQADADAYTIVTKAKADADAALIQAEAQAKATRLAAQADADAIRMKSEADKTVEDAFAREMSARRLEVARIKAFGNKAVFVPTETGSSASSTGLGQSLAMGMGMTQGLVLGKQ